MTGLTTSELLSFLPQQKPFRFVDEILVVDETHIIGTYEFKIDEVFYSGHFPGQPITPGVILLESMCQVGVVAHGYYLLSLELEREALKQYKTLFADAEIEFFRQVLPGQRVFIKGEKIYWRRKKMRAAIHMFDLDENLIAIAKASGQGVFK